MKHPFPEFREARNPGAARRVFPLTPALSLRERGNSRLSAGEPAAPESFDSRTLRLPLPKGEGWGEGERTFRMQPMPRIIDDASRDRLHPARSERGVALVITLVLLSIITFMTITFLVVSQSQQGAVTTDTDQAIARMAADSALARAKAQLLASILATTNEFNYSLVVSTNYINSAGFDQTLPIPDTGFDPLNVNYDHTQTGAPLTLKQQLQNIANLLYDPRPPVFIVTNANPLNGISNDFRYYLDLNRNGRDDPNGLQPVVNPQGGFYNLSGAPITTIQPGNTLSNFFVGDPEWIGALRHPEFAHSADNPFIYRYAYIAIPAGQTLDMNTIHNYAKSQTVPGVNTPWPDNFLRDQGILTSEINLAALLVDLNTNLWPLTGLNGYNYNTDPAYPSTGAAADDAASFLRYRYNTVLNSLANINSLFGLPGAGANAFSNAPIDDFSAGPVMTDTSWPPPGDLNPNPTRVTAIYPWPGAENPNRFYTTQDLFDRTKLALPVPGTYFPNRLLAAGTNNDSYDRYTFYRLLSQLGTDSAPEPPGKMNLNYCNVNTNTGYVVPGMETNFIPWTPSQFFTNAAIRLLVNAGYTVGPSGSPTNLLVTNYVGGVLVTNLEIPLWPTNFYTPSVNRLFQLAANIYDATTVRTFAAVAPPTNGFPSVFRPYIRHYGNQFFIAGYGELFDTTMAQVGTSTLTVDLPYKFPGLGATFNPAEPMVYNIPLIIGAKKGFPNFNEFAMRTAMQVTRKLQFLRQPGSSTSAIAATNQMFVCTISNVFGLEAWNSYSATYPRNLSLNLIVANMTAYMTNGQSSCPPVVNTYTNYYTNEFVLANTWLGYQDQNHPGSALYPLWTNCVTLTNSQLFQNAGCPYFVPVLGQGLDFENPSGFQCPDWWLTLTNRLRFAIVDTDANRIVDYVNLEFSGTPVHITDLLMQGGGCSDTYQFSDNAGAEWCTNSGAGLVPYGILNQINMCQGTPPNSWSSVQTNWAACDFFRYQFPGLSPYHAWPLGVLVKTNTFYAPYVPTRTVYFYTSWEANDPLVHYTVADLTGPAQPATSVDVVSPTDPLQTFGTRNFLSASYRPWGGNPNKQAPESITSLNYKDPVADVAFHSDNVGHSDDWDFPTNRFPNVGWLGRVHRGTPWQTVYLKPGIIDLPTWQAWTGDGQLVTNFGQISPTLLAVVTNLASIQANSIASDAYFSHPTNDWHLLDLFTTALSDSATRGQLSINQTNLAAWSAVLSGVFVLSNAPVGGVPTLDSTGRPIPAWTNIQPAGVYDPLNSNTWPAVVQIVNNINTVRTNFPNGVFHTLGDVLSVPVLTTASPFVNASTVSSSSSLLSDEVCERIPQQVLGLLKCDHTPRFVIYSFGQALKPAPHSIYEGGAPFTGLCTNYQIMTEFATRAVVRIDGAPTAPQVVIESYNVLPPD